MNVAEWIKRAGPIQRKDARSMHEALELLLKEAEALEGNAAPALKASMKAVVGHLSHAERTLRGWLHRNPT